MESCEVGGADSTTVGGLALRGVHGPSKAGCGSARAGALSIEGDLSTVLLVGDISKDKTLAKSHDRYMLLLPWVVRASPSA